MKTKQKMRLLTIKRSEWLRGEGTANSALRRASDGKQCCLGFAVKKLAGATDQDITDIGLPCGMESAFRERLIALQLANERSQSSTIDELQVANDSIYITPEVRESRITKLFAKIGVKVRFVE